MQSILIPPKNKAESKMVKAVLKALSSIYHSCSKQFTISPNFYKLHLL